MTFELPSVPNYQPKVSDMLISIYEKQTNNETCYQYPEFRVKLTSSPFDGYIPTLANQYQSNQALKQDLNYAYYRLLQ